MATELDADKQPAAREMRRVYTETVVDHVLHPRNLGEMPDADGFASIGTADGDTVRLWLRVRGDRIMTVTFQAEACAATVASLSMVTEMARGKTVAEALAIGQGEVLAALGGLPEGNVHCARLAANVLRAALREYLSVKKEPWKKNYRRY